MNISRSDVIGLTALAFLLASCGPDPLSGNANSSADGSHDAAATDASSGSGGVPMTSSSGGASGSGGTGTGGSNGSGGAVSADAAGSLDAAAADDRGDVALPKDSGRSTDAGSCPEMQPSPADVCSTAGELCGYMRMKLTTSVGGGGWICRCGGPGQPMQSGLLRWDCGPVL